LRFVSFRRQKTNFRINQYNKNLVSHHIIHRNQTVRHRLLLIIMSVDNYFSDAHIHIAYCVYVSNRLLTYMNANKEKEKQKENEEEEKEAKNILVSFFLSSIDSPR